MKSNGPREIPEPPEGVSPSDLAKRLAERLASPAPLGTRAVRTAAALAVAALISGLGASIALTEVLVSRHSNVAWLAALAAALTFAGTTIVLLLIQRLQLAEPRERGLAS